VVRLQGHAENGIVADSIHMRCNGKIYKVLYNDVHQTQVFDGHIVVVASNQIAFIRLDDEALHDKLSYAVQDCAFVDGVIYYIDRGGLYRSTQGVPSTLLQKCNGTLVNEESYCALNASGAFLVLETERHELIYTAGGQTLELLPPLRSDNSVRVAPPKIADPP
jgi:hypothetical protein